MTSTGVSTRDRGAAAVDAGSQPVEVRGARPKPALLLGIAAFVVFVAFAGYAWIGNVAGWSVGPDSELARHEIDPKQVQAMVDRLAARLKVTPDDAEGWMMLGHGHALLGRIDDATAAYLRVVELRRDDARAHADVAEAIATVRGRRLAGEPERLLERALELDADNMKALTLAGKAAFDRGDAALAVRHWERALRGIEAGSELARQLQGALDAARSAAARAAPGSASGQAQASTAPAGAGAIAKADPSQRGVTAAGAPAQQRIEGRVSVAAALRSSTSPDDTVFVFARAVEGPKMPLAVVRRQVKDLPFAFTLDDSMAMRPELRLSGAKQVVVGARISRTGSATPQPGDLQGLSQPVAVGTRGVEIVIGEVVR